MRLRASRSFISLFSGCGGLDLGFIAEGFICEGAFDLDPWVLQTHSRNLKSPTHQWDLSRGALPKEYRRSVDVLLAGSPCQGFSIAGKREYRDPRNSLLLAAGRIAIQVRAKIFILENVAGVLSGQHRKYWEDLQTMLRHAGYSVVTIRCQANELGVPQNRTRVVLIASKGAHDFVPILPRIPGGTLRSAIGNLDSCEDHTAVILEPGSKAARIAKYIGPGQKLSNVRISQRAVHTWDIPDVFGAVTGGEKEILRAIVRLRRRERVRPVGDADPVLRSSICRFLGRQVSELDNLVAKGYLRKVGQRYDLTHTFNGKFRRLSWDAPALTVDTRFGDPRYFLHPEQPRGFTVREAARLQGFPDDFRFLGKNKDRYKMIGNAVPPPMARQIARFVTQAILS